MSRATVEEFQTNAARLLEAVEKGEQVLIERGAKVIARLLPVSHDDMALHEAGAWNSSGLSNLERAYGPAEPEYSSGRIIEKNPHYQP